MPNLHSVELFRRINFDDYRGDDEAPKASSKVHHRADSHEHYSRKYVSNKIKTTRYNVFNFLPITFLLQFTKVINVFYLFNMIL